MSTLATTIAHDVRPTEATGGRMQALFWRSPFAVVAAICLSAQLSIMALAGSSGQALPFDVMFCLTAMSGVFLTAGIWPDWNYLDVTEDGLDQQAGLRGVKVAWPDVQSVRGFDGWVELRVVRGDTGRRRVRTIHVFDRYGLGAEAFLQRIETPWLKSRRVGGL